MRYLDISLPVCPGDPVIGLERYRDIFAGNASNDSRLACSVHNGTHVDAPAHFAQDGRTVEQLELDILADTHSILLSAGIVIVEICIIYRPDPII